jgi:hypothetical protein
MKPRMLERLLWTITLTAAVMTIGQLLFRSRPSLFGATPLPSMTGVRMYDAAQLKEAADTVAATNPFRLDRRPASPVPDAPPMASPTPQLPQLQLELNGVGGGPPWYAIVSGIPGRDGGVVVRAGDTLGGISIRSIKRDTLIVQTRESTMTFILKR